MEHPLLQPNSSSPKIRSHTAINNGPQWPPLVFNGGTSGESPPIRLLKAGALGVLHIRHRDDLPSGRASWTVVLDMSKGSPLDIQRTNGTVLGG